MMILPNATIGIIGGGQLGKMLAEAANRMGYRIAVLDPGENAPAFSVAHHTQVASFHDLEAVERLVASADVVTYEFENIDAGVIRTLQARYQNIPQGDSVLAMTQNRAREKNALVKAGLPVAPFVLLDHVETDIYKAVDLLGFPLVVKTLEGGYDGKGQVVLHSGDDLEKLSVLSSRACIAEQFISYDYEASIIGTRSITGEFTSFPVARNLHINNILHETVADFDLIPQPIGRALHEMLHTFMEMHQVVATLAMEVFICGSAIFVNELAPRPHNSGHFTIEGCATSQFEQHIRAICGLPLGATQLRQKTVMYNLLGQHEAMLMNYLPHLSLDAHLHLYGKKDWVYNRKMGHITFTGDQGRHIFKEQLFHSL